MLILLIVQILTESLPISSSGHLELLKRLCPVLVDQTSDMHSALHIVHFYSLLLFIVCLYPRWSLLLTHPIRTFALWKRLLLYGICAELVTTLVYILGLCTFAPLCPLWVGFLLSGIALLSLHYYTPTQHGTHQRMTYTKLCVIGCAQGLAVVPGLSRMGITYVAARWCGIDERHAWWWSLTLALPIFGVGILQGVPTYYLLLTPSTQIILLAATAGAGYLLLQTQKAMFTGRLHIFGWYLLAASIVVFFV